MHNKCKKKQKKTISLWVGNAAIKSTETRVTEMKHKHDITSILAWYDVCMARIGCTELCLSQQLWSLYVYSGQCWLVWRMNGYSMESEHLDLTTLLKHTLLDTLTEQSIWWLDNWMFNWLMFAIHLNKPL